MNREELISKIAEKTDEYKYVVENFVNCYEETISEALVGGEEVRLHGFITFKIKERGEKLYTNPSTKETKMIPAKKKVRVQVSDKLNRKI